MSNMQLYTRAFVEVFEKNEAEVINLNYQGIEEWDSVGHMKLITLLEETFDIMFEVEDIIDFESFQKGIELLAKYNIVI